MLNLFLRKKSKKTWVIFNLIIIDNREFKSRLAKELFKSGADLVPKQLIAGDYLINDLCIERKSAKDFCDSIIDKRIFEQLKIIKKNYAKSLIIIEDCDNLFCKRNIHPNAINGMIMSIMVDYHIPVYFSKNEKQTCDILCLIEKRSNKSLSKNLRVEKQKNDLDCAINLLCNIPGIGIKNADLLINNFKSIKKIMDSDKKDLDIIGKKSSEKLIEFINKEF